MKRRISVKTSLPYYYPNGELPHVTVEELDVMVEKCGSNDVKGKQQIVEACLRLALSVASLYAAKYPSKKEDLPSVALLSLTKAVDRFFRIERYNNNIRGYIMTCLCNNIKDYIVQDCLIRIPTRTFFDNLEKGTLDALNVSVKTCHGMTDAIDILHDLVCRLTPRKVVNLTVNMDPEVDVREILELVLNTDENRRIIELKIIGCSDIEIAKDLKRSKSYITSKRSDLVHKIKIRLLESKA